MKKLAIVAAVAAVLSSTAYAQSTVEIYGLIDAGVINARGVGASNGNSTQFLSSPMTASRIGFKGAEDLGGGLKAGFNLEGGFNPQDGTAGTTSGTGATNGLFSRAANLSLESTSAGKLTLGRQGHAGFQAFNYGDVNGGRNFGSSIIFWNDGSSFGGTSTAKTGIGTITGATFLSNSIRYDSPKFGPFRGSVQYVTGGGTDSSTLGNTSASNRTVVTGAFDQGPWGAAVGYTTANNSSSDENARVVTAGVKYTQDKYQLAGGWANFRNPSATTNNDFDLWQVSAKYNVTTKFNTAVGYYDLRDKTTTANQTKLVSLFGTYDFSKRTAVYAGVARADNQGANGFASYGAGGANINSLNTALPAAISTAGQDLTAYTVGMVHRF